MKSSVVNIESIENSSFGTGFVIHANEKGVYILTCGHVVEDVGTPIVDNVVAKVVARGEFIDMAVLYVSKLHLEALPLQVDDCDSLHVDVIGFSNFNQTLTQKKHINATLYQEPIELHSKEDELFYTVRKIKADDGFNFDRGNSGSPVICKSSGNVIAMVSNKEGSSLGYAIDISNLKEVWQEMPEELLDSPIVESVSGEHNEPNRRIEDNRKTESPAKKSPILKYLLIIAFVLGIGTGAYLFMESERTRTIHVEKHPKPTVDPDKQRAEELAKQREAERRAAIKAEKEQRTKEAAEQAKREREEKQRQMEAERLRLKKEQAATTEYQAFQALVDNNYQTALKAFEKTERIYPSFHHAKEIASLLREHINNMNKPLTKRKVFQKIIKKFSTGAPKELIKKMKKQILLPSLEIKKPILELNKTLIPQPIRSIHTEETP